MFICSHSIYKDSVINQQDDMSIEDFSSLKDKFCLTFDDGYRELYMLRDKIDNLTNPIIIFITTSFIENHCSIWWFELFDYIFNPENHNVRYSYKDFDYSVNLGSQKSREKLFINLSKIFKKLSKSKQEILLTEILNTSERKNYSYKFLTWDMIINLSKLKNVFIGSHTLSHPNLLYEENNILKEELIVSKKIIEEKINLHCENFAIPYGGKDSFNKKILNKIYSCGYNNIFTTVPSFKEDYLSKKLFGRQTSKANKNNYFILKSKFFLKSVINYLS